MRVSVMLCWCWATDDLKCGSEGEGSQSDQAQTHYTSHVKEVCFMDLGSSLGRFGPCCP